MPTSGATLRRSPSYNWKRDSSNGVGIILSGMLGDEVRLSLGVGGWLILIRLALFAVFRSFFSRIGLLGTYWSMLLIALGLLLLAVRCFARGHSSALKPREQAEANQQRNYT